LPTRRARGISLVEVLGAIALLAILSVGAVALVRGALEDTRGQHAGIHQSQVVDAAEHYIRDHYADLLTATATGPAAVPITSLVDLLPAGFQAGNAYGQVPCVRIVQPQPGRLDALVVGEGGESIPEKDIAYVAAHAGRGGGQIVNQDPGMAQGVFGSWSLATAAYSVVTCGASSAGDASLNRLASALFFDGPSASAVDYLYRRDVPGHPELNAMDVPLAMRSRAVVVENDTTDPLCNPADPLAQGRVAVSGDGAVMSCQGGAWRRQGSAFWKDPVPDFAALPSVNNNVGDVRMALDIRRGFVWDGLQWSALAVDETGDMTVPRKIVLPSSVARGTACDTTGAISREAGGLTLACQAGLWKTVSAVEIDPAQSENGSSVIMKSGYMGYPAGTPFYTGGFTYDAPDDTVMASVERNVFPTRDGLIISNASVDMSVGTVNTPTDTANVNLIVQVVDRDTGNVIAVNQARQTKMVFDRAILAVTLSKALPKNANGYTFQMLVRWSRRLNSYASNFYDRSNYLDVFGNVVELTPIQLNWNFDLTY
jgi:hypothetical protein